MGNTGIRVGIGQFSEMTDDILRFAAQLGITTIQMNSPRIAGKVRWKVEDVRALVDKAAAFGLTLEAMLGQDGAAEQIENY